MSKSVWISMIKKDEAAAQAVYKMVSAYGLELTAISGRMTWRIWPGPGPSRKLRKTRPVSG